MNRRGWLALSSALVLVLGVGGALLVRNLHANRVIEHEGIYVAVEGRDLWPFNDGGSVGVGTTGRLGLVGGRCLGFVPDKRMKEDFKRLHPSSPLPIGIVVVWPAGVRITGTKDALEVRSQGKSVHLGRSIEGGDEFGHDLSGIREHLPAACRNAKLMRVGLNE